MKVQWMLLWVWLYGVISIVSYEWGSTLRTSILFFNFINKHTGVRCCGESLPVQRSKENLNLTLLLHWHTRKIPFISNKIPQTQWPSILLPLCLSVFLTPSYCLWFSCLFLINWVLWDICTLYEGVVRWLVESEAQWPIARQEIKAVLSVKEKK